MVYIKNSLIIITAFAVVFFLFEGITRLTINHPASNVQSKVYGLLSENKITEIYFPHSRYWTVEDGYKIYRTNNLGLTGNDVKISDSCKYILVIGSSYIQATVTNPDSISTSIFQAFLGKESKYQVINIGYSGLSPLDAIIRLNYYTKIYKPNIIIYVMESSGSNRIKEKIDSLKAAANNIVEKKDIVDGFTKVFRQNFEFLNLIINTSVLSSKGDFVENAARINIKDTLSFSEDSYKCIQFLGEMYKNKFLLISMINSDKLNNNLGEFCIAHNILYGYKKINIPELKVKKEGHLTNEGNYELGTFVYKLFIENEKSFIY